jgi:PTH1 family peptidyl-tRNA hydrolase
VSRRFRVGLKTTSRTSEPADLLVVGLGNPGADYVGTRHNVGAEVVVELCHRHEVHLRRSREQALVAEVWIDERRLAVAFPQTFMNESGRSVGRLYRRYGIDDPARLVVVHDEIDLPVGTLRIKEGGGLAGHNGLRSVSDHLRTRDYLRVRIGVGRPPEGYSGADHVLRRPGREEATDLARTVTEAAEAVEAILWDGVDAAMGRYNARG